ncbi:MAG: twin-arginine translocation signal domain-containing protein, partial [Planctomycetota bacterium]
MAHKHITRREFMRDSLASAAGIAVGLGAAGCKQ